MGSTRIKGTKLKLELGESSDDFWADLTTYGLDNDEADSDVVTFEDAGGDGSRQFKLTGTAIQSTDEDSFWSYAWDHTGEEVPYTLAPHGNETPSKTQPHFTGTVKIGPKPKIGGDAGNAPYTFDFEWNCTDEPTKDDGTTDDGTTP